MNLFSCEQWKEIQDGQEQDEEEGEKEVSIADLPGVGAKLIGQLTEARFDMLEKIAETNIKDLTQVKGLGKVRAEKMIKEANKLLKG